jgi:hypothetical protein
MAASTNLGCICVIRARNANDGRSVNQFIGPIKSRQSVIEIKEKEKSIAGGLAALCVTKYREA